jgi:hypothetical protein
MTRESKKLSSNKHGKKNQKASARKPVSKASDIPVTFGAQKALRSELKSDITTLRLEMKSEFKKVDARFNQIDAQLLNMNANIEKMNATNSRMLALYEQQNSQNKVSFEGAEFVRHKQETLEKRVEALEEFEVKIQSKLKSN